MAALSGPRLPPARGAATHLVVLCHGYGADGNDLIGLAPHWQRLLPTVAFAAPNAPQRCPGSPGYQWFPISRLDPDEVARGVESAAPALEAFLDAELARLALTADRLALVGFSQGTMLSLQVGLRRAVKPVPTPNSMRPGASALSEASALAVTGTNTATTLVPISAALISLGLGLVGAALFINVAENLELRLHNLKSAIAIFLDLAVERHHLSRLKAVLKISRVEPYALQSGASLPHRQLKDRHAAGAKKPRVADFGNHRRHFTGAQLSDRARV